MVTRRPQLLAVLGCLMLLAPLSGIGCDPGTTDTADTMTAGEEILDRHLEEARRIFAVASARPAAPRPADGTRLRAEAEALRWFPLPAEAAEELAGK